MTDNLALILIFCLMLFYKTVNTAANWI